MRNKQNKLNEKEIEIILTSLRNDYDVAFESSVCSISELEELETLILKLENM